MSTTPSPPSGIRSAAQQPRSQAPPGIEETNEITDRHATIAIEVRRREAAPRSHGHHARLVNRSHRKTADGRRRIDTRKRAGYLLS